MIKSNRAKGRQLEKEWSAKLQKEGWTCYRPPTGKFVKQDFYGADLLCYHPLKKSLMFLQVKSHKSDKSRATRGLKEAMGEIKEVWQKVAIGDKIVWEEELIKGCI